MIIPVSGVIKTKLLTKSPLNTFTNLIVSPAFVFFLRQFLALCHKGNNGSFPFSSHSTLLLLLEIGVSQNLAKLGEVHIKCQGWEGGRVLIFLLVGGNLNPGLCFKKDLLGFK